MRAAKHSPRARDCGESSRGRWKAYWEAPRMHSRLEEYLDEIDRRLQHVPSWEREEWREKARQHLAALAEAHEELGSTPEQALRAAIRQFGQPAHLAQGLDPAAGARTDRDASRHLAASAFTLGWYTIVTVFAMSLWVDGMHKADVFGTWRAPFAWAAILIFWAGLGTGGALLGRLTGGTSLGRFVMAAFPLLVLAAV